MADFGSSDVRDDGVSRTHPARSDRTQGQEGLDMTDPFLVVWTSTSSIWLPKTTKMVKAC